MPVGFPIEKSDYQGAGGTVVVLGSSTAAGQGSSKYSGDPNNGARPISSTSWVGLLSAALGSDFIVYNQSLSGTSTATSISRFSSDVVKLNPKFVILATSIWNEPNFSTSPITVTQTYLQNIKKLVKMCGDIGAVPIIHGPYPKNGASAETNSAIAAVYRQLEKDFPMVFDFYGSVVDYAGGGGWLSGLSVDGTHPNDAGYAALANTIPVSFFYNKNAYATESFAPCGVWKLGAADSILKPLSVSTRQLKSFTMRAKVRMSTPVGAKAFMSANQTGTSNVLRIRNALDYYDLAQTNTLVASTVYGSDLKEHDLVMKYNATQNRCYMYIDGTLIGSSAPDVVTTFANFCWGGSLASGGSNALGCYFSECALWSSCLLDSDILAMASGASIPKKSLEAYITMRHEPNTTLAKNEANTTNIALSPSAWTLAMGVNTVANGSVATALTSLGPTGASTTVREWMIVKNATGLTRYIPMF